MAAATQHHDLEHAAPAPSPGGILPSSHQAGDEITTSRSEEYSDDEKHSQSRNAEDPAYVTDYLGQRDQAIVDTSGSSDNPLLKPFHKLSLLLAKYHIESVSIAPVPQHLKRDRQWWSVPLFWFSANFNILSFSEGTLVSFLPVDPTAAFCVIIFISLFSSLFPAYFLTFGPKLGMRQMIHTRYSWGWFAPLIALLNAATLVGYTILNCILGGQTISAVSPNESLTPAVGIVIVAVVSLLMSFGGIRVMHITERWMWVPTLIAFCIFIGCAGTGSEGLHFPANPTPPTVNGCLSLTTTMIGFLVPWAGLASDTSLYLDAETTPTWSLFWTSFLGFFLGSAPLFLLGASVALSASDIPAWADALEESNGALFNLVLSGKAGNFGKFVTVIIGLSIIGNTAASIYSTGINIPEVIPILRFVPRFVFPILIMAIVIPVSIVGATAFYDALVNFTGVLAYWIALWSSVVLVDHLIIRKDRWTSYNVEIWDQWTKLPPGIAAFAAAAISLAILVPAMYQTWFVGPLAEKVGGDLGFELGFVACALLYFPLRTLEMKIFGR